MYRIRVRQTPKGLTYRIQVRQDHANGAWYWRIVSRNGQVILTSETYATKSNAQRASFRFYQESAFPGGLSLDSDE